MVTGKRIAGAGGRETLKVMVVDDSAFMRKFIGDIIKEDPELELAGTARDGLDALTKCKTFKPHVITMDVEMPRLNGLDSLRRLMQEHPLPVVMVSSVTRKGSEITIDALAAGAVDFITKPAFFKGESSSEFKKELSEKIKMAASAQLPERVKYFTKTQPSLFVRSAVAVPPAAKADQLPRNVVALGASTGGPRALDVIFRNLPEGLPAAFFITQHMPAGFTASLSQRLDRVSGLTVREAKGGENIREGEAYVAPGGYHLVVKNGSIALSSASPVQHVRPSADVMMDSLVDFFGSAVIGVVLTGMGRDGTHGMSRIKAAGGLTIVQDPATAVIASMPQSALKKVQIDLVVPLEQLGESIIRLLHA